MQKSIKTLLVLFIAFFAWEFFLRISPSLVLEQLATQYQTNALGLGAIASCYYLGYSLIQIPAGILLDKLSIKTIGIGSISVCVLAILTFILTNNLAIALSARTIMGAASAFSFIGVLAIAKRYSPQNFSFITSITISLGTLIAALAQVGASFFVSASSWHTPFIILSLSGIILIILIIFTKNKSEPKANLEDNKEDNKIGSFSFKKLFILIINPCIFINGIIGGLLYLPTSLIADTWGIHFLELKNNFSASEGSIIIMFLFLGWAIGSALIGFMLKKGMPGRKLVLNLGIIAIASIITLIYLPTNKASVYALMLTFGIGSSAQVLMWNDFNTRFNQVENTGLAIALANMIVIGLGSFGQILMGKLIASINNGTNDVASIHSLYLCFLVLPVLIFIGTCLGVWFFKPIDEKTKEAIMPHNQQINRNAAKFQKTV
jgi:MFS family permease